MSKESRIPTILIGIGLVALPFLVFLGISRTNSLLLQWLFSFYLDFLVFVVIAFLIFHEVERDNSKETKKRHYALFAVGALLFMLFIDMFPVFGVNKLFRRDGSRPQLISYRISLLRDAFEKETVTCTIPREEWKEKLGVTTYRMTYTARMRSETHALTFYYLSFTDGESKNCAHLYSYEAYNYILQKDRAREAAIEIEYYKHSGVLKSLDGIDLSDTAALKQRTGQLAEIAALAANQKNATGATSKEAKQAALQNLTYVIARAVGHSWEAVETEITNILSAPDAPINYHYEAVPIRTRQFEVGTVAFVDRANRVFYVVSDQSAEEMVRVPFFGDNEPADIMQELLTTAGVSFTLYVDTSKPLNEQIIHYCEVAPDTYVPKGYKITVGVEK